MSKYRYAVKKEEPANELASSPILTGLVFRFWLRFTTPYRRNLWNYFLVVKPSIFP